MSFLLFRECINGSMAEFMMVNGLKTKCKAKAPITGQMEEYMKETTIRIRNMALESIHGLMEESMKALGPKESNTVKASILNKMGM